MQPSILEPKKLLFAGTPSFAVPSLTALLKAKYSIIGVYTQPDRPAGRGQKLSMSPVKEVALQHGLPVFEPETLSSEETIRTLAALHPDMLVVVAYGLILPKSILDIPSFGCLNVHASLLPRWRGAAPIERAIAAGDTVTGVTLMHMDMGLDTGDILTQTTCPILATDTAETLRSRLAILGAETLVQTLAAFKTVFAQKKSQDATKATYARKLSKEEAHLNWQQSADTLERKIRAYNPWPIAYTVLDGIPIRIHKARLRKQTISSAKPGTMVSIEKQGILVAAGAGSVQLLELQLPGKKIMSASLVVNGHTNLFRIGRVFR